MRNGKLTPNPIFMSCWQQSNVAAITRRLAHLSRKPSGILCEQVSQYNHIVVRWTRHQLWLCYRHTRHQVEEIESRLDPTNPLALLSEYTRAMLLALVWQPTPRRILLVGLGGGRLQMVLHHYLEEAALYTVEIDPVVVDVACRFFGIAQDSRQQIIVNDGRSYIRSMPTEAPYDMIVLDAYRAFGIPRHLRTREFYAECCMQLSPQGVVATNLQASTPLYDAALKTFALSFRHTATFPLRQGNVIVIGSNAESFSQREIVERTSTIEAQYRMNFSLPQFAQRLVTGVPYRQNVPVLSDTDLPLERYA
jgi:spermidine synthase